MCQAPFPLDSFLQLNCLHDAKAPLQCYVYSKSSHRSAKVWEGLRPKHYKQNVQRKKLHNSLYNTIPVVSQIHETAAIKVQVMRTLTIYFSTVLKLKNTFK